MAGLLCYMQIAVIGAGYAEAGFLGDAENAGRLIAGCGAVLLCGGLGGVMEAACRGAKSVPGSTTVGIIPDDTGENKYVDIVIKSGMGHARNVILVKSADAVIAIGGGYGTLSEIAVALKCGKTVCGYRTWKIEGVRECLSLDEAVVNALDAPEQTEFK